VLVPAPHLTRRAAPRVMAVIAICLSLLATHSLNAQAAWPPNIGPATWPVATAGTFRYHLQPGAADQQMPSANDFRTEFGAGFDAAEALANAILATTLSGPVDVYAIANPRLYAAWVASPSTALSPHPTVALNPVDNTILVNVPELLALSPTQLEDEIRNAVSQLTAHQLAGGAAPSGFAAGIGLYVELPTSEYLARLASTVQTATQQNTLLTWFDLNRPVADADRELAVAESYAVIAYLIERYDIPSVRAFLEEIPKAASWQDAARTAFQADPASIEEQWRADLPIWTVSGWRDNLIAAFDLGPARNLLAQGQYVAAKALLDPSLNLYRQLDDPAALQEAQTMMSQADTGIQAEALMTEVEAALHAHDYARASNLLDQAEIQYRSLPAEHVPESLLATFRQLAADGLTALGQLKEADRMADSWGSYPEARAAAKDAGNTFARLGDEPNRAASDSVLNRLDNRQRRLVVLMGCLGLLTLAWLGLWLRARGPAEVKWG
jgi:hypothetical protein